MVKHIVFFKLTDYANNSEKEGQLHEMDKIFSALPEKLSYIIDYRTGKNFTITNHAWDFVIDSVFKLKEDLQRYQVSNEHLEATKMASHIAKEKAVVDYEY